MNLSKYQKLKKVLELLNKDSSKGYMSYNIDGILNLDLSEQEYNELFIELSEMGVVTINEEPDGTVTIIGKANLSDFLQKDKLRSVLRTGIEEKNKEDAKDKLDTQLKEETIKKVSFDKKTQIITIAIAVISLVISILALIISYLNMK